MSFVSFKFILFLAFSFFVYFIVPYRFEWIVLLIFSLLYYYLSSHLLVAVLILVSLFTFFMGRCIGKTEDKKKRKLLTKLSIIAVLCNLIVFKYSDFLIENINALIHGNISLWNLVLPLGISYYTLQAISYLSDISKKKIKAEENFFHFLLYMSYFPQIVQGPIPKYKELSEQLFKEHPFDYERICFGLQLMAYGIAKKIILADRLALPVAYLFEKYDQFNGPFIVFAMILYAVQLYADFSGGIDTIRGISEVFGITLGENFRQPYFSRSIEEFWRRWHISLGAWMKEYVFFPLSLSKRLNSIGKKLRKPLGDHFGKKFAPFAAMFIVYLCVGIWHGADWKYAVYGVWNGFFIMNSLLLEERYKKIRERLHITDETKWFRYFQMLRTFTIVSLGRLISRGLSVKDSIGMFSRLFVRPFDYSMFTVETMENFGINMREWLLCLIVTLMILLIDILKEKGMNIRETISKKHLIIRWALYLFLIMMILVFGKYGPGYEASNFIYGNF